MQVIAFFAVILMAVTPQGFMPTSSANGFAITLCSGHADTKLAVTPDHPDYALLAMVYGGPEEQEAPADDGENTACSFASASTVSLLASAPSLLLHDVVTVQHLSVAPRRFAVRDRINIPPATGPPAFV